MAGMRVSVVLSVFALLCTPVIGEGASIKGKVVVAGPVPAPKKIEVTIDQYVCGSEKDAGDLLVSPQKELRNAVVWIDNPPAGAPAPPLPRQGRDRPEGMHVHSPRGRSFRPAAPSTS